MAFLVSCGSHGPEHRAQQEVWAQNKNGLPQGAFQPRSHFSTTSRQLQGTLISLPDPSPATAPNWQWGDLHAPLLFCVSTALHSFTALLFHSYCPLFMHVCSGNLYSVFTPVLSYFPILASVLCSVWMTFPLCCFYFFFSW